MSLQGKDIGQLFRNANSRVHLVFKTAGIMDKNLQPLLNDLAKLRTTDDIPEGLVKSLASFLKVSKEEIKRRWKNIVAPSDSDRHPTDEEIHRFVLDQM